jgi:hypothetical protein
MRKNAKAAEIRDLRNTRCVCIGREGFSESPVDKRAAGSLGFTWPA